MAAPNMEQAAALLEQLKAASDLAAARPTLAKLKLMMAGFAWMATGKASAADVGEMALSREVLETALLLSARARDTEAFARHYAQLKPFYHDLRPLFGDAGQSSRELLVLGLNLTRLLSSNALAEFHTELERVPHDLRSDRYVRFPVELEQFMAEGSYGKVLAARREVPSAAYEPFVDVLAGAVRDEIASCSERAYESLALADAARHLMFADDTPALLAYAERRRWVVRDGRVFFAAAKDPAAAASTAAPALPATDLMRESVAYAAELDRIV